ncbi:MAG: hypothetical protein ACFWTY_22095 [Shouchella clausii]|jgi:hypothetical protein
MNAVEARQLAKNSLENKRISVLLHIDKVIKQNAEFGYEYVVVELIQDRLEVISEHRKILGCPLDEESIQTYKDYLTIAGFTVDELERESDVTTSLELVISWEENE